MPVLEGRQAGNFKIAINRFGQYPPRGAEISFNDLGLACRSNPVREISKNVVDLQTPLIHRIVEAVPELFSPLPAEKCPGARAPLNKSSHVVKDRLRVGC